MLSHMGIGLDGGVAGVHHSVLSKDLAVWLVGVCLSACLRLNEVLIEDIKGIDVTRSELRAVDLA